MTMIQRYELFHILFNCLFLKILTYCETKLQFTKMIKRIFDFSDPRRYADFII
jgi:hypothetical protein